MLLSVVIPAYNEEANIQPCLSELRHTLGEHAIPYEAIVVNDNSSDNTRAVVEAQMEMDSSILTVKSHFKNRFVRLERVRSLVAIGDSFLCRFFES